MGIKPGTQIFEPEQLRDQRWMLVKSRRVPGWSALLVATLAHLCAFLFFVRWHAEGVHIIRPEYQITQKISGSPRLVLNPEPPRSAAVSTRTNRSMRARPFPKVMSRPLATATQILQKQARKATAALSQCIRFRQIYGFYPGHDYQLPVRMAGEPPFISPERVPPHFEQFVTVEVTIDVDGRVAEAHIVSGLVDPPIQKTLLSGIREFKYKPATRDGIPIPSQLDIVVHIPS